MFPAQLDPTFVQQQMKCVSLKCLQLDKDNKGPWDNAAYSSWYHLTQLATYRKNWAIGSKPTEVEVLVSFGAKSREKVPQKVKWVVLHNNGHAKIPNHSDKVFKFQP